MTTPDDSAARLRAALSAPSSSDRLQAALAAGTHPNPQYVDVLVERSAIEPDFYVRDMLTWSLTRHPASITVPLLLRETQAVGDQARSQALHSLSKIGHPDGYLPARALLRDDVDEVARAAWRTAVALAPTGTEAALGVELASQLSRGDRSLQQSLSRALAELGPAAEQALTDAAANGSPEVRVHAIATGRLIDDPDESFEAAVWEAKRFVALGSSPVTPKGDAAGT